MCEQLDNVTRDQVLGRLVSFRETVEREAGVPLDEILVPMSTVLFDVCQTFGLSEEEARIVMSDNGAPYEPIGYVAIPILGDTETEGEEAKRLVEAISHVPSRLLWIDGEKAVAPAEGTTA